ncbi:hypothetical protein HQ865_01080 [Mucilaginibacter mali]|uniref:Uncharacterized protein n=1 Tax=Mucilaginibacter mali TaxID=2740462 RepID=A0A7D4QP93_9SPHI|nr:hypothetical protein [Mucilaginibacter mali]QKJ28409.1 hypothetical protein HQ865_01080 [Mucilaginibacter mali]
MAASITKIKGFIQTYIGYNFENLTEAELEDLRIFLSQALIALRWEMEDEFNNLHDDAEKSKYVLGLQSQLIFIADGITNFQFEDNDVVILPQIFKWLQINIFQVLEDMCAFFRDYFNLDAKLPSTFFEPDSHSNQIARLTANLQQHQIDEDLSELVLNYAHAVSNSDKFKVKTWRQLNFHKKLIAAVEKLIEPPQSGDINLELLKLFVRYEFNSIQVYAYFVKYIEQITTKETAFEEQQGALLYLLKIFNQVRVESDHLYEPTIQSLKASVLESITAELNYLEQKNKLYQESFKGSDSAPTSKFYFGIAVTLAELMFLFRVFLEVGFMHTKFKSYLYEFVHNHIKPEKEENFSMKSMRNLLNSKPFPDRLVRNIRGWLVIMIAHIDLYYNINP